MLIPVVKKIATFCLKQGIHSLLCTIVNVKTYSCWWFWVLVTVWEFSTCDSLNENAPPQTHIYFSIWSLVVGTLWERLESMALLEEMCQREQTQISKLMPLPSCLQTPVCGSECDLSYWSRDIATCFCYVSIHRL